MTDTITHEKTPDAHSSIVGGSSAARILGCPGSVDLLAKIPESVLKESSTYADEGTGTAAGFALAVGIIFGYMMLSQFMNVWAQGGFIPAYAASFAPVVLGFIASWIIMWRRNA